MPDKLLSRPKQYMCLCVTVKTTKKKGVQDNVILGRKIRQEKATLRKRSHPTDFLCVP